MSINIRRGLFRLWLILAATWLLFGSYLSLQNWEEYRRTSKDSLDYQQYKNRSKFSSTEQQEITKKIEAVLGAAHSPDFISEEQLKLLEKAGLIDDEVIQEDQNDKKKTFEEFYSSIILTLSPPLLLLVTGWAILWALSGFISDPHSSSKV